MKIIVWMICVVLSVVACTGLAAGALTYWIIVKVSEWKTRRYYQRMHGPMHYVVKKRH